MVTGRQVHVSLCISTIDNYTIHLSKVKTRVPFMYIHRKIHTNPLFWMIKVEFG